MVFFRICGVNSVHPGALQNDVCFNLNGAQGSCRVRGEVRVARSATKNDHAAFLQMANGLASNKRLRNFVHLNGGLQSRENAFCFQGALQRQTVDHGGQHAHVVCLHAVHALSGTFHAAENVTAANDNAHLHSQFHYRLDFAGIRLQLCRLNTVGLGAHQRFAAELEENSLVLHQRSKIRLPNVFWAENVNAKETKTTGTKKGGPAGAPLNHFRFSSGSNAQTYAAEIHHGQAFLHAVQVLGNGHFVVLDEFLLH